jgi:hypothetical protein
MNKQNEHLDNLKEIRSIMERSSRFLSLSGLSGVFAGAVAILGTLAVYLYKADFFFGRYCNGGILQTHDVPAESDLSKFVVFLLADASLVLLLALTFGVYFTTRNARRKGLPYWDATARRMLTNLFIPLIAGGMFCLALLYHHLVYLIAPSTLIFYGLSLINASKFTLNDVRYLGISEIALGLIAMFFVGYGMLIWAIGFGILHVVYGVAMYLKYERTAG